VQRLALKEVAEHHQQLLSNGLESICGHLRLRFPARQVGNGGRRAMVGGVVVSPGVMVAMERISQT
jgi:hypothetical protein